MGTATISTSPVNWQRQLFFVLFWTTLLFPVEYWGYGMTLSAVLLARTIAIPTNLIFSKYIYYRFKDRNPYLAMICTKLCVNVTNYGILVLGQMIYLGSTTTTFSKLLLKICVTTTIGLLVAPIYDRICDAVMSKVLGQKLTEEEESTVTYV